MVTNTYTILYNSITEYKSKYYNNPHDEERCAIYEKRALQWIKNASICGNITHEEAIALYDYTFK